MVTGHLVINLDFNKTKHPRSKSTIGDNGLSEFDSHHHHYEYRYRNNNE